MPQSDSGMESSRQSAERSEKKNHKDFRAALDRMKSRPEPTRQKAKARKKKRSRSR